MDFKALQRIFNQLDFKPKKHLGQNFIIDTNIIHKIINLSDISREDVVLEIGPGFGSLTDLLVEKAKKVYAVEVDPVLSKYLEEKYSIHNNIEIIPDDILKAEIPLHTKVVSNIPYKITGPILETIFYKKNPPQGILTIENSIAVRLFLSQNYKNLSRISIGLNTFMKPISKYVIPRASFYPIPKIDLALIKLIPKENLDPSLHEQESIKLYLKLIAGIMPYKNKNIVNALHLFFKVNKNKTFTKEKIRKLLQQNNFENEKLFNYKIDEFVELSKIFST
ncbi:MAG: ribosomal RNA small subunit methyltransferase A [Candidatus Lokiarchaeota archaeon]|nr:ribosomal RNA small subunit methyltransferase A [Candidatus Lokiarchaeota archaeon]